MLQINRFCLMNVNHVRLVSRTARGKLRVRTQLRA
jgi:hypothetical protein